jgi:hypothetical protein
VGEGVRSLIGGSWVWLRGASREEDHAHHKAENGSRPQMASRAWIPTIQVASLHVESLPAGRKQRSGGPHQGARPDTVSVQ